MMMKVVNDGKCIEDVERHLERRLKEDDFDDDFDDEFNHHHHPRKGGGEKEATKARGYTRPSWPWRDDDRDSSAPREGGVRTDGRAPNENVFVEVKIVQITSNTCSSRSTRAGK